MEHSQFMDNRPNCFVTPFKLADADRLEKALLKDGFELSKPPYTLFSGKKKGVSCTLYASGKLTVQGKGKDEFIEFILEPDFLGKVVYTAPKEVTRQATEKTSHIGCDEAGKGDFFGPLCISGVFATEEQIDRLIDLGVCDSKKIPDPKILTLSKVIKKEFAHHTIRLMPAKYNGIYEKIGNLNLMLAWGHASVIETIQQKTGAKAALVDQFTKANHVGNALRKKGVQIALHERTKAESDPIVAAASILARAAFLEGMDMLSKEAHIRLPKGASPHVKKTGREILDLGGVKLLDHVSKKHFKTYKELF